MRFSTIAALVILYFITGSAMAADYKVGSLEIRARGHVRLRKVLQRPSAT